MPSPASSSPSAYHGSGLHTHPVGIYSEFSSVHADTGSSSFLGNNANSVPVPPANELYTQGSLSFATNHDEHSEFDQGGSQIGWSESSWDGQINNTESPYRTLPSVNPVLSPLTVATPIQSERSPPPPSSLQLTVTGRTTIATAQNHKCSVCLKVFTKNNDLNRHQKSVHRSDSDPVFRCMCSYASPRKDNYLRHMRTCGRQAYRDAYLCNCGTSSGWKDEHEQHVIACAIQAGTPGRPRSHKEP